MSNNQNLNFFFFFYSHLILHLPNGMAGSSLRLTNTCATTTTAASTEVQNKPSARKATKTPWLGKPNKWNPLKENVPQLASKPSKPRPNTHLALNTWRQNPSQATDKPCPGELYHKKSITSVLRLSLATRASRNKRNPVRGALASPHIQVTSVRKPKEDKGNRQRKTRKKNKRKSKGRLEKPYPIGPHNFRLLFPPDWSRTVKSQCLL